MVKHNNVIPNVHLRKHWQRNVKVWLNQASRKRRRLVARRQKAIANGTRPIDALRPVVRCQTIRYNHRTRFGRGKYISNKGFTLAEIKAAGLGVQFARSIGIAVDHRRRNRCQESLQLNKNRLQNYVQRLVLYPRGKKAVTKAKSGTLNDSADVTQKVDTNAVVNTLPPLIKRVKSVSNADFAKLKEGSAFRTIRQEWNNQRNEGKRQKKQREAAEKK